MKGFVVYALTSEGTKKDLCSFCSLMEAESVVDSYKRLVANAQIFCEYRD